MLNSSLHQKLTVCLLISAAAVFADTEPRDDCDLGTSTSIHGYSPWISIQFPTYLEDSEEQERGEGCEIQVNLNQPHFGQDQFAFVELSRQEYFIGQNEVHFRIKKFDGMLEMFENQQTLKFFSLRFGDGIVPARDIFSLSIRKPERSPRSFWQFNAAWNGSDDLNHSNQAPTSFAISNELKQLHFSIIWGLKADGTGRYIDIEITGDDLSKSMRFEDNQITLPNAASLGYIEAQPALKLGNEMYFFTHRAVIQD